MSTERFLNWTAVFHKTTNSSKTIWFQKIEDLINPFFMYLFWPGFYLYYKVIGFFHSIFTDTHSFSFHPCFFYFLVPIPSETFLCPLFLTLLSNCMYSFQPSPFYSIPYRMYLFLSQVNF